MHLHQIQLEAWRTAEQKGLHDALDKAEVLTGREDALYHLARPLAAWCALVQEIKRHGVPDGIHEVIDDMPDGEQCVTVEVWEGLREYLEYAPFTKADSKAATIIRLVLTATEIVEACEVADNPTKLADELADIIIRVADLAHTRNIDLEEAVEAKLRYNTTRPYGYGTPAEVK